MPTFLRKAIATLCAASLVLAAFPSIPRAEGGPSHAEAMAFFERNGVVGGPTDVLRSYLTTGRELTPIGDALYRTLSARYNTAEAVTAMRPSFDRLRQAGPYSDAQRAMTERTVAAFRTRFGEFAARAAQGEDADSAFQWGTLTEALMTGVASAEQQGQPQYQQVALADGTGTEFWDPPDTCRRNQEAARAAARARNVPYRDPGLSDCLAFRMNQNRVLTYNRQLRDNQRVMNSDRPRQVPLIPETGHYNVEMFQYGYWKLRNQYDDIMQALNVESMVLMASLMGEQIREVRYYLEPGLRQALENRAKTHFREHRGRRWSIYDIVQQRMRARRGYLEGALTAIGEYQARMNTITAAGSISDSLVESLGSNERVAMRWLSLSVLATQEYAIRTQLEALDPSSPDSTMVRAALEASPFSEPLRERYGEQAVVMRDRLLAVQRMLQGIRTALLSANYMASLDMIQAGLSSAQRELTEVSADYSIYVEAPSSAFSAATESGQSWFSNGQLHAPLLEGWNVGNWGVSLFGAASEAFGFQHGANVRRVREQLPQLDCIARLVAGERRLAAHCVLPLTRGMHNPAVVITERSSWADVARLAATLPPEHCLSQVVNRGGMAAARCLTIAMNPDAARRFQEVRLTGGDATVTDPLRIASSLRVNREQISDVAGVNKWVRAGTSFVTWTVALALAAPIAGWALRAAVGGLSRVPILSEPLLHFESRLLSVKVAPEFLGSSNSAMRALSAFGWRTASIGGRQAVFTGFSGGVSAGMTSIQHQWMGADSPFESATDAAWQGFEGGVIWSNDSFHPMLGYIGMPSSAFRGMGAVSSGIESVAMRGVTGNIGALVDVGSTAIFRRAVFFGESSLMSQASRFVAPAFTQTGAALTRILPPFVVTAGRTAASGVQFIVASADQLAKYVLLSKAVGYVARETTYSTGLNHSVLPSAEGETEEMRLDREAMEVERRIKTATEAGHSWEASPIWLLLPVAPAQQMLAANQHRRSMETVKLYAERDASGRSRIAELGNLTEDAVVQIPGGRIKVPLAQTVFELAFKTEQNTASVRLTPAARMEAIRLAVDEAAGVVNGSFKGVNPKAFYDITRMDESSPPLRNGLRVNDEVIAVAREKMARAFVENPELARRFFNTPDGQFVEGFGVKTYFERYAVARALRTASRNLEGVTIPREILELIEPVNKRAVDSAGLTRPFAETFAKRVHEFRSRRGLFGRVPGKKSQAVAEEALFLAESVARWREGKHPLRSPNANEADLAAITPEQVAGAIKDYNRLLDIWGGRLQARLKRGQLAADEFALFDDLLNLVRAEERRFNSFNNVETVKAIREELMVSLRNQYASRPHIQEILRSWDDIYGAHTFPASGRVSQPGVKGPWEQTVAKMEEVLQKNTRVTEAERTSLLRHLTEMRGASWAIKDKSGNALPGWRPEQFEALITTLAMYVEEGQGGREVQIFQLLKTGGGKTLLNFEGLLPLVEADAAIRGLKVLFLTVSKGLEGQAKNDFAAYGTESKMEFNTYEGLKGEIVEGKMAGRNARRKYWILGDELDGAALQPATTVGEQIGSLTRTSSSHRRHEEIDLTIEARLQARDASLLTGLAQEARQIRVEAQRMDAADVAPIVRAADDLVQATEKLRRAVGPEPVASARTDMATALRRLRESTADLGASSGESIQAVRRSMTEIDRLIANPPTPIADRNLVRDVWRFVNRQANLSQLTGSETSVIESVRAARSRRMTGERNMERRHDEIRAAEVENASARAEIDVVRQEAAQASRFEAAQPGVTLVKVAERGVTPGQPSTPANWQPVRGPTRPGDVLMSARTLSERGTNRAAQLERDIARRDAAIAVKRQELSVLEAETNVAARFESVDAGARIVTLADRVAMLEGRARLKPEARPGHVEPMLNLAMREMTALREKLTPAQRRSHDEHLALRRKIRDADEALAAAQAARDRNPSDPQLERARQARHNERETLRTQALAKVTELTGFSDGAARPLLRLSVARDQLASARARLDAAPLRSPERAQALREVALLSKEVSTMTTQALRRVREISREVGEEIAGLVEKAPAGFEGMARRMLRMRRAVMREFGADTSPIVRELEVIRDRAEPYSRDPELFSEKPEVATAAMQRLQREYAGGSLFGNLFSVGKMTFQVFAERPLTVNVRRVGQSRIDSARLLKATLQDPLMAANLRAELFFTILPGLFFPRMWGGRSSWAYKRFFVMLNGPHHKVNRYRLNGVTNKVEVIHNGNWFENMDDTGRMFEELKHKTDVTLPYREGKLSTVVDIVRGNFIGTSATAGRVWYKFMRERIDAIAGKPSGDPPGLNLRNVRGFRAQAKAVEDAIVAGRLQSRDQLVITKLEEMPRDVRADVEAHLVRTGQHGKEGPVVTISEFQSATTRAWLTAQRAKQPEATNLVTISVPNQNMLRRIENYLISNGIVTREEIAKAFVGALELSGRPQARIVQQKNFEGLTTGRVRVLLLDSTVGGRGLDLNFRGDRSGRVQDPFNGITNHSLLVISPELNSQVHNIQTFGRIDVGRVLPGARRDFTMLLDIEVAGGEAAFRSMLQEPFFVKLADDPVFKVFARARGETQNSWALFEDFILAQEALQTPSGIETAVRYREIIRSRLSERQLQVENDLHISGNVIQEQMSPGRYPALDMIQRIINRR